MVVILLAKVRSPVSRTSIWLHRNVTLMQDIEIPLDAATIDNSHCNMALHIHRFAGIIRKHLQISFNQTISFGETQKKKTKLSPYFSGHWLQTMLTAFTNLGKVVQKTNYLRHVTFHCRYIGHHIQWIPILPSC